MRRFPPLAERSKRKRMPPEELRAIRASLGLTQREFGVAIGLRPAGAQIAVSRWERGRGMSEEVERRVRAVDRRGN